MKFYKNIKKKLIYSILVALIAVCSVCAMVACDETIATTEPQSPKIDFNVDGEVVTAVFDFGKAVLTKEVKPIRIEPTCSEDGEIIFAATVEYEGKTYGDVKKEIIPAMGHSFEFSEWVWNGYESASAKFVCANDKSHTKTVQGTVSSAKSEQDSADYGKTVYMATAEYKGTTYTDVKIENLSDSEHLFEFSEWVWNGYESAKAKFTCVYGNSHEIDINALIKTERVEPTCEEEGKILYIATAIYGGKSYTDVKIEKIPAAGHSYELSEWIWNGYGKAEAKFVCANDNGHIKTVEAEITAKSDADGSEYERIIHTAKAEYGGKTYTDVKIENLSGSEHSFVFSDWVWNGYETAKAKFTCVNDGSHEIGINADIKTERMEPTCEEKGKIVYIATATFDGKNYTDVKSEEIAEIGHSYNFSEWVWSGYQSASAKFVCANDNRHIKTVAATVTARTEPDIVIHTATVVYGGQVYTEEKTENLTGTDYSYVFSEWIWDGSRAQAKFVCVDDDKREIIINAAITTETVLPTCEGKGKYVYIAKATYDEKSYTDVKINEIAAKGHSYYFSEWIWDGYSKAEAEFVCRYDSSHIVKVEGEITETITEPDCTHGGTVFYTATAEYRGLTYTSGKQRPLSPIGHNYEVSEWVWDGYKRAEAKLTCVNDESHTGTALGNIKTERTEPNCTESGLAVYTASVYVSGKTYTDIREEILPPQHNFDGGVCTECGEVRTTTELTFELSADETYYIVTGTADGTVKEIFIPKEYDGLLVKEIGDKAFFENTAIKSVNIPDGVTYIGKEAFRKCYSLQTVSFPDSVTEIGEGAFRQCVLLKDVTLPYNLKNIGSYAFDTCISFTKVNIPANVASIGYSAFTSQNLISIAVASENSAYYSFGNCLIEKSSGTLVLGCLNSVIPNGIAVIGSWAFASCGGLTSVSLPKGVKRIERNAFYNCYNLTEIDIPDGVEYIGEFAFLYCDELTSVVMPDSVTECGYSAFEDCVKLTSVTLSAGLKEIYRSTFAGCRQLKEIVIPEGVTQIGAHAFRNCTELSQITLPDSLINLNGYTFDDTAWFNGQPDGLVYLGKFLYKFKGAMPENTVVQIKDGTVGIVDDAFFGCKELIDIVIPDSVTTIGNSAFSGCTGLTAVTLGNGVKIIGDNAFYGCTALNKISLSDSVTEIGAYAFRSCTALTEITLPDGLTSIGNFVFYGCTGLKEIIIPDSVKTIGNSAFYDCTGLTDVTIGKGVETIGRWAFRDCSGLTKITIPGNVKTVEPGAFSGCHKLSELTIENGMTVLGVTAFGNCRELTEVTIPGSVERIDSATFINCVKLNVVTIENGVAAIGPMAFRGCGELKTVYIPSSVTLISYNAFAYLNTVDIYFDGTKETWNTVAAADWDRNTESYVVHCTDGDIVKGE